MGPEQNDQVHKLAHTPLYCEEGKTCDKMWKSAISWVEQNSTWKIDKQTDTLITTKDPFGSTSVPTFSIKKLPLGDDKYEIVLKVDCAHQVVCSPTLELKKADFVKFILEEN
jgi:hypothetical protein